MINEYLNQLAQECQAAENFDLNRRLPDAQGVFAASQRVAGRGMTATVWRMHYRQEFCAERTNAAGTNEVQIIYFLNHGMTWQVHGEKSPVQMAEGELCIYRNQEFTSTGWYPGGCDLLFQNIRIPGRQFDALVDGYFEGEEARHLERLGGGGCFKTRMTPDMYQLLRELREPGPDRGGAEGLYLQGSIERLLAVSFDAFLQKYRPAGPALRALSRTQLEAVQGLRRSMEERPWEDFDGERLARESNLPLARFGRAFAEITGSSPHAYLIEQRLAYAASLLASGESNVSQAAMASGYSNMSHFAAAFKRKYGVSPREYR